MDAAYLDELYGQYNRRRFVSGDPLVFVHRYRRSDDREVVALVTAALAYGRVRQIQASVARVLERLGPGPAGFLAASSERALRGLLGDFRHRFHRAHDVEGLLTAVGRVRRAHGSLERCFLEGYSPDHDDVAPALSHLVGELGRAGCGGNHLVSDPADGSACKRMNLFLRWMVRRDRVDAGRWPAWLAPKLLVPLDTHMHRISMLLGLTGRRSADLRTAREVTRAFARLAPHDPVRYDWALTRVGMARQIERLRVCRPHGGTGGQGS
ncbi:MAG: hypothetical protein BWX88_00921 [Planctomycetes bacterium ADurb.Bin126]|nr:MAG: hypothetical protein BWX88_00921 [Planctomycetes bacterium ADurb.Bin126]HOD82566.1 TIGR02757 family protein [Phycisphaerae bacterium]HQL74160.1 TIGR02757 family protein [Phycisphaerae bacterium]